MDPTTTYSFTIYNVSGGVQSYSLFSQPPAIDPMPEGLVSHSLLSARNVPSASGTATMAIQRDNFFAICGATYQDEAACVSVLDRKPVRLGSGPPKDVRGTTVALRVDSGTPFFGSWEGSGADCGRRDAFCLNTGDGFTLKEARDRQFIAALGLSTAPSYHVGLHTSFTPAPNTKYQIAPSRVYYIIPASTEIKQYKASEMDLSCAFKVDFSTGPPHVKINPAVQHDAGDGVLHVRDAVQAEQAATAADAVPLVEATFSVRQKELAALHVSDDRLEAVDAKVGG
ncbi:uncharacterized protein PG986_000038 [Apiospora aurea]|uniref:Uncharacterized protein n=1 Tax=Apiospora aurea TaxID=335848 RepID=A0ABR1QTU0_9PEZI